MGWSSIYTLSCSEISYRVSAGLDGIYVIFGDRDARPLYYGRSDGGPNSCIRKRLLAHADFTKPESGYKGNKIIRMLLKSGDEGTLRFQYKECKDTRFEESVFIRDGLPIANRRRELKPFNLD